MKRYLLFAGARHYACGGWKDFIMSVDSIDEIEALDLSSYDWAHAIDSKTGSYVFRYGEDAFC